MGEKFRESGEKKILITGGAGFIGSNVSRFLLEQGSKVVIIDNFNDYYSPSIKYKNIADIQERFGTEAIIVMEGDIRDASFLEAVFSAYAFDAVIHLAACAGVRPSIEAPAMYTEVNINGTVNILEAMVRYKTDKLIFASSSSVYGNNEKVPFHEDDRVDCPVSPYAATKKAGELLCHTYHQLYGMNVACLRFFTVYGPGQRPDLAIHKFMKMIWEGQELPFYGDGNTKRDYTYIDDIVDGILKALYYVETTPDTYEIFNLGESRTISLNQMLQAIERITGKQAKRKVLPMQSGDVMTTYADITKAKKVLGYRPQTDFEEGIEKFFQWFVKTAEGVR